MNLPTYEELSKSELVELKMLGIVFEKQKAAIQLLTLRRSADAIFHLTDADWIKIAGLDIAYRPLFEQAIKFSWEQFEELWGQV